MPSARLLKVSEALLPSQLAAQNAAVRLAAAAYAQPVPRSNTLFVKIENLHAVREARLLGT
jgi:hypothetical protein